MKELDEDENDSEFDNEKEEQIEEERLKHTQELSNIALVELSDDGVET
jgi:hypothetical protein